jgi:hypothetical protein
LKCFNSSIWPSGVVVGVWSGCCQKKMAAVSSNRWTDIEFLFPNVFISIRSGKPYGQHYIENVSIVMRFCVIISIAESPFYESSKEIVSAPFSQVSFRIQSVWDGCRESYIWHAVQIWRSRNMRWSSATFTRLNICICCQLLIGNFSWVRIRFFVSNKELTVTSR